MKILLINSLYAPYKRGGAEVVFESLVGELVKHHEVVVVTVGPLMSPSAWIPKRTIQEGVIVYRYCPLNIFSFIYIARHGILTRAVWRVLDMFNLHSYFAVRNIIRQEKPDVVMTNNLQGMGYMVPLAIRHEEIRHIHTLHDVQLVEPSGLLILGKEHNLNTFPWIIYRLVTRILFGSPDVVIFPSEFLYTLYSRYHFFKNSIQHIIPNPGVIMVKKEGVREKDVTITSFFYLGQLEAHKGVLWLASIFSAHQNQNWRLVIAGSGALEEEVRELAKRDTRITYLGSLSREEVIDQFAKIDFTVVPSLCYENCPTVVIESLSNGVPVIAAQIGGTAEKITDGENGYLFNPGDERSCLAALEKAASANNYSKLSEKARETIGKGSMQHYIESVLFLNTI